MKAGYTKESFSCDGARAGKKKVLKNDRSMQWAEIVWNRRVHFKDKPLPHELGRKWVSERTNEWAQRSARAKRAVQSKLMSERCEGAEYRMAQYSTPRFHNISNHCARIAETASDCVGNSCPKRSSAKRPWDQFFFQAHWIVLHARETCSLDVRMSHSQ